MDDTAVDVSQAEIATGMAEGEFLVIKPEKPKHGCVQVVDMDLVLHRLKPELVGRPEDVPALTPPPAIHMVNP